MASAAPSSAARLQALATASPADEARCYHCGRDNPAGSRWLAAIAGEERRFCCAGCLAVAQTIDGAGLGRFYATRSALVEPAAASDEADEWLHDDAALAAGLVRELPGGRREASLLLENVSCGACVWLIESWLARRPGIAEVEVNYALRRARVAWRDAECRLPDVLHAVSAIGYRAHPYDPARREEIARTERRSLLTRTAIALLAMMQVMMFAVPGYLAIDGIAPEHRRLLEWASLTLTLPVLVYSAAPFFRGAWRDLALRRLGMDVPVALGIGAAFVASAAATLGATGAPVYYDSITMFVALLLVGRYVETLARQRAGEAIEAVARHRPACGERLDANGSTERVAAALLEAGDRVLVRPGASVPADGEVLEGASYVEEALLTGESWPRRKSRGDAVLAGSVNRDGALVVQVRAAGEATRLAGVLRLVDKAAAERPRIARLADRAAAWFVAGLLALAALTALAWSALDPARALEVTFALLVVSCPCALSLATPAAIAAAAGALARRQVVLARSDALETLARVTHVVFDKTGTLTEGQPRLQRVQAYGMSDARALAIGAALEAPSEHPIARAIVRASPVSFEAASQLETVAGMGVEGTIAGRRYRLGRPSFVAAWAGAAPPELDAFARSSSEEQSVVALGSREGWHASFALGDALRPGVRALVAELRAAGITPLLLSGDREACVQAIAREAGIDEARAESMPHDKREAIAALQARGAVVAMIGDGVNDAPALAQSQVSVSLASATPLAQWTSDVVILAEDIGRFALAVRTARTALAIVRQNLGWAALYNAIAIPAAAFGLVTPLAAAAGMSASSLIVVLNALRLTRNRPAGVASQDPQTGVQDPCDVASQPLSSPAPRPSPRPSQ